jgi:ABC-type nitrate/sulfonate/bicarbonate transport system substrate-binding protein
MDPNQRSISLNEETNMRSHTRRTALKVGALAASATLLLSGCASGAEGESASGTGKTVKIAQLNPFQAADYLPQIAHEKGFFKEEGITAEFVASPQNPITPLLAGDVDIAITGVNGMAAIEQDQDVRFIAGFPQRMAMSLVVPANSPVAKLVGKWPDALEALKGKNIGVTVPGALVENLARAMLVNAGISDKEIKVVPAGDGSSLVAGLSQGTFDSGLVPSPLFEPLVEKGMVVQVINLHDGEVPGLNLPIATPIVAAKWANANPNLVTGYQRAVGKANSWAKDPAHSDELAQIVGKKLGVAPDTIAGPVKTFRAALGDSVEFSQEQFDTAVKMLKDNGVLTRELSYEEYVLPFKG